MNKTQLYGQVLNVIQGFYHKRFEREVSSALGLPPKKAYERILEMHREMTEVLEEPLGSLHRALEVEKQYWSERVVCGPEEVWQTPTSLTKYCLVKDIGLSCVVVRELCEIVVPEFNSLGSDGRRLLTQNLCRVAKSFVGDKRPALLLTDFLTLYQVFRFVPKIVPHLVTQHERIEDGFLKFGTTRLFSGNAVELVVDDVSQTSPDEVLKDVTRLALEMKF